MELAAEIKIIRFRSDPTEFQYLYKVWAKILNETIVLKNWCLLNHLKAHTFQGTLSSLELLLSKYGFWCQNPANEQLLTDCVDFKEYW